MIRKQKLVSGNFYHIFNKSIAKFQIFNNEFEYERFLNLISYYSFNKPPVRYSRLLEYPTTTQNEIIDSISIDDKLVEIIAFCLMPTHFHLILKQLKKRGISTLLNNVGNSYTHYFNKVHKRKGPLWVGPFKNVLVSTDEQLLHLTRYIHLNPVTSNLVANPNQWDYSSYKDFIKLNNVKNRLCQFDKYLNIDPMEYQNFCKEYAKDQKELQLIKHMILE